MGLLPSTQLLIIILVPGGGITSGPDGNLWFTEEAGNVIIKMTPSGEINRYPVPTYNSNPHGITSGPDGNLWFTEGSGNKIGRITTNGTITEYPITTTDSYPFGVTTGPDGNLWFTEYKKIGRFNLTSRITRLTYTGKDYGTYHDPIDLSANLLDTNGKPVTNALVTFTIGNQTCSASTDNNGNASCSPQLILNQRRGSYQLIVSFASDDVCKPSKTTNYFSVYPRRSTISYTGPDTFIQGNIILSAQLTEDGIVPISGRRVQFYLNSMSTCLGITNTQGIATCTVSRLPYNTPLGVKIGIIANFDGDGFYLPAQDMKQITILR